jgi:metal-sulfur cluster biosynthetic enzyme
MATTSIEIIEALRNVYDPEIPLNIVDLGLVYEVRLKPAMLLASELAEQPKEPLQDVEVDMTLTSPGCPSHVTIGNSVKNTVEAFADIQMATVNFIWQPQWSPERISPEGKVKLGIEV